MAAAISRPLSPRWLTVGLLVVLAPVALAFLAVGPVDLPPLAVLRSLIGLAPDAAMPDTIAAIALEVRLPRLLLGLMVGASLGLAGAVLQGLLRNPLAEPGLLGISAGAGLGAVLALYFGLVTLSPYALPGLALLGAAIPAAILTLLSARKVGRLSLILTGVAVSSAAVALTSLALNLAPNPYALSEMVLWLLGSLKDRSMADLAVAAPLMAVGWVLLLLTGRGLDALALGPDVAASLGIDARRLAMLAVGGTALSVGAATAVAGSIGFVGLVVPHLLRPLVGAEPRRLLLPSALGGALALVLADLTVRLLPLQTELMLGVATAFVGAPFFLWLLTRIRAEGDAA